MIKIEQNLENILSQIPDYFICITDSEGKIIVYLSDPEKILGWQKSELDDISNILPAKISWAELKNAVKSEEKTEKQLEFLKKDKNYFPGSLVLRRDLGEEQEKYVWIIKDKSFEKELNEQIFLHDRLASLGEIISSVVHELNNPLSSVIGFAQLAQQSETLEEIKEDLGRIFEEAQRCRKLINNLLDTVRKHKSEKKILSINNAIEKILELRNKDLETKDIKIVKNLGQELPDIFGDVYQLQQVFLNLLNNAVQSFEGKENFEKSIIIATFQKENTVIINFSDNGAGIPSEILKKIFEPFFTTKENGTGLGLSVCRSIILNHDGNISVQSKFGEGTTFTIELPVRNSANENRF